MSPDALWPSHVTPQHDQEMHHIRAFAEEMVDYELEADYHPLLQTILEWASIRTSKHSPDGYRIKSIAQLTMSIPPDAYDQGEPTDRQTRNTTAGTQELQSISTATSVDSAKFSTASGQSADYTEPEKRNKDTRRTPDYTTRLTPNDPSKFHHRLLWIHELKRLSSPNCQKSMRDVTKEEMNWAFDRVQWQNLEQAQVAFWNYREEKFIYVMCHIGLYFSVRKYGAKTPRFGADIGRKIENVPVHQTKAMPILNEAKDDFSSAFKTWWTKVKNEKTVELRTTRKSTRIRRAAQFGGGYAIRDLEEPEGSNNSG